MNRFPKPISSVSHRILKVESLERRDLFAADLEYDHLQPTTFHHTESSCLSSTKVTEPSSDAGKTELKTEFRNSGCSKVEFEIEKGKLEIAIERAQPSTSYAVSLNGNVVATLVTNTRGKASLKTTALGKLTTAVAGDVVSVEGIGSGSLVLHGSSISNHSFDSSKLHAVLAGTGTGKAEFETKGMKQKLAIEVRGLRANTSYDVTIDGVTIGQLTTNKFGKGELKMDSSKGRSLPVNFPVITANSIISIGSASSGTFATTPGHSRR